MPKLWTYLIKKFFVQFLFSLIGIIIFLIVIRFNAIAGFATSGTDFILIIKFIGLLIPYVLPLAIPISTLNAALLVSRRLCQEKHLTTIRSGSVSIFSIFTPLILVFTLLGAVNFFTAATLAPLSKVKSKALVYDTTIEHPLFITQSSCPIKIRKMYTDVGKNSSKDSAYDLLMAFKNTKNERISLLIADRLYVKKGLLKGKNLAIISSVKSSNKDLQDDLLIENDAFMSTDTHVVDALLYVDDSVKGVEYLDFFQLIKKLDDKPFFKTELFQHLNLTLAPLSFGLLGLCFGLSISRKTNNKSLFIAISLATLFIVTIISIKSLRNLPYLTLAIYAGVHMLLFLMSFLKLKRIEKGIE